MEGEFEEYEVRLMTYEDIPRAIEVWTETGLAEGTHTLYTWYAVDPDGIFVAATEKGEIYGTCAAIILNDNLAFVGLYAVKSKYQGRGVGTKIWQKAMEHVGDRNAGLNSVPKHLRTYRDLAGFKIVSEWNTLVYEGHSIDTELLLESVPGVQIDEVSEDAVQRIIDYDQSINGYCRSKAVSLSMMEEDSFSVFAHQEDDATLTVCGYGIIKKNIQGTALVGPLYADNINIAESILLKLIRCYSHAQETGITIMVIDCNTDAVAMVEKLGLEKWSTVPRCYTQEEVSVPFEKIFGHLALNFAAF